MDLKAGFTKGGVKRIGKIPELFSYKYIMEKSAITLKNYEVIVSSIRAGIGGGEGYDFLLDFPVVERWIETNPTKKTKKPLSRNSQKTYYVGVKSTLRDLKDSRFDDVMKLYDAKILGLAGELVKQEEKQELSEAEKSKWICWCCVITTRDNIGKKYEEDKRWRTFQDYLILCLYSMMPPERLDYTPMKFVADMPTDTEHNYCVLTDMKATFILNNYKTFKSKGQAVYDAPYELMSILHAWRKINTSEWFLVKKTDKTQPLSSHELGQIIPRIFEREINIPATLNILRHSFITNMREGEMPLLEKKRLAERMGHSLAQAEKYLRLNVE